MNAVTPFIESELLDKGFDMPPIPGMSIPMGSNIARDLKSRASDFPNSAAAIFEYIVNAYESYDIDQHPEVEVTVKGDKIVVKDHGVGMNLKQAIHFWTLHAQTVRRENGRNKRGYHGSGMSAFYRVADKLEVRTVKDGVLNVMSLDSDEIERAARTEVAPRVKATVMNKPTDEANGTVITISRLRNRLSTEEIRALRAKVEENLRFVMIGAKVTVNGVEVQERPIAGVEAVQASDCGNFSIRIIYNDAGHANNDDRVFFMVGGVYVAAMQTGKEGHRFSHQVSAVVDTTREWAEKHFEHRREQFMSEARDLTLKTTDPAARQLHDFAEQAIRAFMKKLDEEDARRRKEEVSESEKRLIATMSRIFSNLALFGGPTPSQGSNEKKEGRVVGRTREQASGKRIEGDRKPKITFDFKDFESVEEPYQIQHNTMTVLFNRNSKVIKALSQDEKDMVRNAVLWDIGVQAVSQIVVEQKVKVHEEQEGPVSPQKVMELFYETWGKAKNQLAEIYAGFLDRDPTVIA